MIAELLVFHAEWIQRYLLTTRAQVFLLRNAFILDSTKGRATGVQPVAKLTSVTIPWLPHAETSGQVLLEPSFYRLLS